MSAYELQVLLPIHNEAESIRATIHEMHQHISPLAGVQFLLCEDGSKDNTKEVLRKVAQELPAKLLLSDARKGYSRAVRDGMLETDAPYLLCLDSDGQCEPRDFPLFWESRQKADIVIGWRVNRADTWLRRTLSRTFYYLWRALYRCPINDPSCPFILARREVILDLARQMGAMQQGYWWEFTARAHRLGYSILELPVTHRARASGQTQVYHWRKLPGIGLRHYKALFQILRETRHSSNHHTVPAASRH